MPRKDQSTRSRVAAAESRNKTVATLAAAGGGATADASAPAGEAAVGGHAGGGDAAEATATEAAADKQATVEKAASEAGTKAPRSPALCSSASLRPWCTLAVAPLQSLAALPMAAMTSQRATAMGGAV